MKLYTFVAFALVLFSFPSWAAEVTCEVEYIESTMNGLIDQKDPQTVVLMDGKNGTVLLEEGATSKIVVQIVDDELLIQLQNGQSTYLAAGGDKKSQLILKNVASSVEQNFIDKVDIRCNQ